jgi:hypothetical protein
MPLLLDTLQHLGAKIFGSASQIRLLDLGTGQVSLDNNLRRMPEYSGRDLFEDCDGRLGTT